MHKTYLHSSVSHESTDHPKPSDFERHCHNVYELLYVVRGEGSYIVEGMHYPLCANTLMLLRPTEYHYVCPVESAPYERYVINFDESVPLEAAFDLPMMRIGQLSSRGVYFSSRMMSERILPVFRTLNNIFSFPSETSGEREEAMVRSAVTQILLLLSVEDTADSKASSNSLITGVIDYLNNHLTEKITLENLAQEFFISKFYLCRAFHQYTGMPPMTYLNVKRIAFAQQLIDQGVPTAQAATQAGFGEYSSFYRVYRKETGYAPSRGKQIPSARQTGK